MGISMGHLSVNNMKRNFSTGILKGGKKDESEEEDE